MILELKESNSPFWLIGTGKNKTFVGSSTNIPCYYKSINKQKEIATQIFKNDENVLDVYLLTGTQWDNMPSGAKEEYGYIKNKGKHILSRDEVLEATYPKDMSRDPLPKKGVKTYTSTATALENKGDEKMKLELKNDSKNINEGATKLDKGEGSTFENAGTTWKVLAQNEDDTLIVALDSEGNERNKFVVAWGLQSDGSWNQGHYFQNKEDAIKYYEKRAKKTESFAKDEFIKNTKYCTNKYDIYSLKNNKQNYFVMKKNEKPWETKELVQTDIDGITHLDKLKLKESKIVEPIGNPQTAGSFVNIDIDLDHMEVSDFIIRLTQAIRSEQNAILEYTTLRSANGITNEERTNIDSIIEEEKNHMIAITTMLYKQLLTNHSENVDKANDEFVLPKFGADMFDEKSNLKESIETLLTKVEASVRMSDEYYVGDTESGRMYHGLGSALDVVKNLITKSGDQFVIQNVTLADDSKLTESVDKSSKEDAKADFDKLIEPFDGQDIKYLNEKRRNYQGEFIASIKYNDSYKSFVDNIRNNWEKIYNYDSDESYAEYTDYGSKQVDFEMNTDETIDRITVYVEYEIPTVESVKLKEEYFSSVDEFINELKTDTNYDEIAYHINQYRKLDKKQASELMDLLFEIEDTKSPKECVQDIINSITKTEDTVIFEKDNKWHIEVDVEYDSDVANQIFDNLARVIGDFNKNSDIKLTDLNLKDGKFYFATNKEVDEKFVEDTLTKLFDEATNYEYQINIK